MASVRTRPMTPAEFEVFRAASIREYAAAHASSRNWTADDAEGKATAEFSDLLPEGLATERHLLLTAEDPAGTAVGSLWVSLDHGPHRSAWIYDIVVDAAHRGQGLGRALLAAAESEATRHGAVSLGLNVLGDNAIARHLYETAGYETITLQMRKQLASQHAAGSS